MVFFVACRFRKRYIIGSKGIDIRGYNIEVVLVGDIVAQDIEVVFLRIGTLHASLISIKVV